MKDKQPVDYEYEDFADSDMDRDFFGVAVVAFIVLAVGIIMCLWWLS